MSCYQEYTRRDRASLLGFVGMVAGVPAATYLLVLLLT